MFFYSIMFSNILKYAGTLVPNLVDYGLWMRADVKTCDTCVCDAVNSYTRC
jgi:hypothetical protein